jgi:hypothetical protein
MQERTLRSVEDSRRVFGGNSPNALYLVLQGAAGQRRHWVPSIHGSRGPNLISPTDIGRTVRCLLERDLPTPSAAAFHDVATRCTRVRDLHKAQLCKLDTFARPVCPCDPTTVLVASAVTPGIATGMPSASRALWDQKR